MYKLLDISARNGNWTVWRAIETAVLPRESLRLQSSTATSFCVFSVIQRSHGQHLDCPVTLSRKRRLELGGAIVRRIQKSKCN